MSWADFDKYTISIIGEDELAFKEYTDDADFSDCYKEPPPSYDSIIEPSAILSYIDFWPYCLEPGESSIKRAPFDKFGVLVDRANKWLLDRSDIVLRNVETVEKKVTNLDDIYNGNLYYKKSPHGATYIKGLRLYFAKERPHTDTDVIRIEYKNVIPIRTNPGDKCPQFETMDRVMETINARLEKEPLDGQIVSIDTVVCKVDGQWWVETNGDIDWDTCSWADSPDKHTFQFLRIFYQVGPTFKELIGFHDFVPDRLASKQSIFDKSPVYTEFPSLVQSARIWSKKEGETLRITNVQTLKTQYDKTREKAFDRRSRLLPDVPFTMNVEDLPSVSFLRVAYVIPIGPDKILPLNSPFLSCKTFIPGSLPEDEGKYQSLHEVATYALAWLHATRSKVVCAEMFGPVRESSIKSCGLQATDTAVSSGEWSKDNNGHLQPLDGLYCIRVYIDGVIREPPEGWHLEAQPIIASKCEKCKVS